MSLEECCVFTQSLSQFVILEFSLLTAFSFPDLNNFRERCNSLRNLWKSSRSFRQPASRTHRCAFTSQPKSTPNSPSPCYKCQPSSRTNLPKVWRQDWSAPMLASRKSRWASRDWVCVRCLSWWCLRLSHSDVFLTFRLLACKQI